ncbi:hypothetical protein GCM10023322_52050 [Rugosimonospora acidiphila]|uniref:Sce7726 family protein n=1 Tax=Rugosimonospora acidiphila TaxID=556531 RepID=A0ABP9S7N9_9ACTN
MDVAVINGDISGFEIKSDEDKLARLAGQVDMYGRVLDRAALVTTDRYVAAALTLIPAWWSVWIAKQDNGIVALANLRAGHRNASVEPFAVAQLLWREEAMAELRARELHRGLSGVRRWFVWQRLAESVELEELQAIVRGALRARRNWPGGQ